METKFFQIDKFISESIIFRSESMFQCDIDRHHDELLKEIKDKRVLVIGGAGTIGSSFIKAVLKFYPKQLVVIDINENGLTELTRDVRSTANGYMPDDYITYPISYSDPIFEKIFRKNNGFDIIANFSAHKHVRSEKDHFSVQALIENNVIKAKKLLDLFVEIPPSHFFCVSTDKAANPVNIMGASKKVMEEMIMTYSNHFKVTTARFANVAFSNGSLLDGYIDRLMKKQPLVAPTDIKRYFVSPEESGHICMLACVLGQSKEVFFPKLNESQMLTFSEICDSFVRYIGLRPKVFEHDIDAKEFASLITDDTNQYPVVYFESDTTGEKDFEEFFIEGEDVEFDRFASLGVVKNVGARTSQQLDNLFESLEDLFSQDLFNKELIVDILKSFLPNFEHVEKGKNLDDKM